MQNTEPSTDSPPAAPPIELGLSDILAHRSSVLWHEAVGLVLTVAEAAVADDEGRVPPIEAVFLAADGSMRIESHAPGPEAPVALLRTWLNELLQETPAPPPLADLAQGTELPAATLGEFVGALDYFARPNRREELEALARRVLAARQAAPIERELATLTAKIGQTGPTRDKAERRRTVPWFWHVVTAMGRSRLVPVAAGAAILALAFPVVAWRVWTRPALQPDNVQERPELASPVVDAPDSPAESTRPVRGPYVSFHGRVAGTSPQELPTEAARSDTRALPGLVTKALPSGLATAPALHVELARSSLLDEAPRAPANVDDDTGPAAPAPTVSPTPSHVFTPDDADVVQPVLLSSSLPSPAGPEPATVTIVDLVIDEDGDVDRATLASPAVRFEERMLLSAVKAWRFRPATKDGVPVKYRARVMLTF